MSTVGLELINFINPDLTWKTVTKGNRSATRRARNFTARAELLDKDQGKVDETNVSDTEKHGVAILGCRFSEKVEHVPIKKRKSVVRSPSPLCRTSLSCLEMLESASNGKRRCRARDAFAATKLSQKLSKENDNTFDHSEDFSGIEILAAVACNNSLINDVDNVEGGAHEIVELLSSAMPSGETVASPKNLVYEDKTKALSLQDNTLTAAPKSPTTNDIQTTEEHVSSRDGRLHWDLNLMMDAWEQPHDILTMDCQANAEQSVSVLSVEPKDDTTKALDTVVSTDVHEDVRVSKECETCSSIDRNHDECVQSSDDNARDPSISNGTCTKASGEITNMAVYLDDSACAGGAEEKDVSPAGLSERQNIEVCPPDTVNVQLDASIIASSRVPNWEMVAYEIDGQIPKVDAKDSQRDSVSHEDGNSNQEMTNLDGGPPIAPSLLGSEPGCQSEEFSYHHPLRDNDGDVSAPDKSVVAGQPVVTLNAKGQANEASAINISEVNSPEHSGSEELMQMSSADSTVSPIDVSRAQVDGPVSSLAKVLTTDYPSDDSFGSDVYPADKSHLVGNENTLELQAGYDFEDGELRETDEQYCWDENEEDGEVEHVDYGSDDEEEGFCGLGVEKEIKIERRPSPGSDNLTRKTEHSRTADVLRDDSVSPKARTSDVTTDKDVPFGVGTLGACNRGFLPCIEERDSICRKYVILGSRTDNTYSVYSRDEREANSKKLMGREMGKDRTASHMRGRSPGGRRFANPSIGCWESERRYSPTYRGIHLSGPPRPKSVVESRAYIMAPDHADHERTGYNGGFDNRQRQFINSKYNNVHERVLRRRRSPTNRDDAYGMHASMVPVRDISPIRGSYRRYNQGVSSGIREEYERPMPEDYTEYSSRMRHRLRRERSISPVGRLRSYYTLSYKRSRSRSRSRSPNTYLAPRERNEGSRFCSRSPDFRSDGRIGRVRHPFHKRFAAAAQFEEGFASSRISPQCSLKQFEEGFASSRISPQRNLRWLDERSVALDDLRRRRSPVGMSRHGERFDNARSMRRLNSDDPFRPIRPRKFPNVRVSGRGGEYECSDDDRRKHGDRYGMVHRTGRYVANDYHNSNYDDCNRVTDRRTRDALRRCSED